MKEYGLSSLSQKLTQASEESSTLLCKLGNLLTPKSKLNKEEKSQLQEILNAPSDDPTRVSNSTLAQVLREEGFDISNSSVDRHRRKTCSCYRKVK
jgi:transposase